MRRRWFALALAALALGNAGCFRLCERWFGPNCCGCDERYLGRDSIPPRRSLPEDRIPPAALPGAPRNGGAPPAALPPVPTGTGTGAYGGT
jgi:hypothetical protein